MYSSSKRLSTVIFNIIESSPIQLKTFDTPRLNKPYDLSCMFSYPTKDPVYEHDLCQTDYYDPHRKNLMDTLGDKYKVAKLKDGVRLPRREYYQMMYDSKIILAPIGYGSMALLSSCVSTGSFSKILPWRVMIFELGNEGCYCL